MVAALGAIAPTVSELTLRPPIMSAPGIQGLLAHTDAVGCLGFLDSGFRRNDGGDAGIVTDDFETRPRRNMKPKKLILSRKGFDSASGGCPSPIFPDGTMYSLPIPSYGASVAYGDLRHGGIEIGRVVEDLTRRRIGARDGVHLDPDVRPDAIRRSAGWQALFGQAGQAHSHLANQGVGAGDVFLLFGLFRRVEELLGGWRFVKDAPNLHVLWGWLQIEQVCQVDVIRGDGRFHWAFYHDHFRGCGNPSNTLYVATQRLDLNDAVKVSGAGVFPRFDERLVLTAPDAPVSRWRLPRWFYPDGNKTPLTYHPDRRRWRRDNRHAYLQSVGRGQEFVLDSRQYPEAVDWVGGLLSDFGASTREGMARRQG